MVRGAKSASDLADEANHKAATAVASAAFSLGASTVPRYWPCFLMSDTRQLRSLAAVNFCLAAFFVSFMSGPCCCWLSLCGEWARLAFT